MTFLYLNKSYNSQYNCNQYIRWIQLFQFSSSWHKFEHCSKVVSICILIRVLSDMSQLTLSMKHVVHWSATRVSSKLVNVSRRSGNIACLQATAKLRVILQINPQCGQWTNWKCLDWTRSGESILINTNKHFYIHYDWMERSVLPYCEMHCTVKLEFIRTVIAYSDQG